MSANRLGALLSKLVFITSTVEITTVWKNGCYRQPFATSSFPRRRLMTFQVIILEVDYFDSRPSVGQWPTDRVGRKAMSLTLGVNK